MFSTFGHDSITLHYQPLMDSARKATGMEALMRWHHRQRGSISPEAFIPIFEESGLIVPLSRWALGQACRDATSWNRPLFVAVKLSAIQFEQDDLSAVIRAVLDHSHLPPSRLEVQVTEASLRGDDRQRVKAVLSGLREEGVRVALADFGGEHSALSHVRDFPLTKIKIARSLVSQIEAAEPARSIIRMVIELAHSKGLSTAADGIETEAQFAFLAGEGCDCLQGFLLGRPALIEQHFSLTGGVSAPAAVRPGRDLRHAQHVPLPQLARLASGRT